MIRLLALVLLALTVTSCAFRQARHNPTRVMVVATVHSAHRDHPTYSYEHLFATIRAFSPDVVAVEMRREDLGRGPDYLARNYPYEMRALAEAYGPNAVGFDWLGAELEGRIIPENWWQEHSWLKRLEREKAADANFSAPEVSALQQQQRELIRSATAASLNDGRYDAVTRAYYRAFARSVAGTPYRRLADFYRQRDERIADNLTSVIRSHPGQRVAIVLGADHRAYVVDELRRRFGSRIAFVPVR